MSIQKNPRLREKDTVGSAYIHPCRPNNQIAKFSYMYVFDREKYSAALLFHMEDLATPPVDDFASAPPRHGSTFFNLSACKNMYATLCRLT
jgi:hypothetical protein